MIIFSLIGLLNVTSGNIPEWLATTLATMFAALITGFAAIYVMIKQNNYDKNKENEKELNTYKTTKYFLINRSKFPALQAIILIYDASEKRSKNDNEEEQIKKDLKFYSDNINKIEIFISDLTAIKQELVIYISNKIMDVESIDFITKYTEKIDKVLLQYNNLQRYRDLDKNDFIISCTITELLNEIYYFNQYIEELEELN